MPISLTSLPTISPRQPFTASYLGIKDRHGEWNPQSEAFNDEERLRMEQGLLDLARFDRAALPNCGAAVPRPLPYVIGALAGDG